MQPTLGPSHSSCSAFLVQLVPVFLAFLAVVLLFQRLDGAYESEFGSHPDEAAHYVTGLMIRDYLASGLHGSPMAYADNYYKHYPKVALGNWPPVFYLVQAPWMLVFGPGRVSALCLMAALAAMMATVLFNTIRMEFGGIIAATGILIFISLPLVQKYSGMVMDEMLTSLFMFGAICFLGKFLDHGRAADAVGFGVCAALSILTKGTGGALVLAVPLAVLWTRKFSVLKRPALWFSALIVLVLAGPWTWIFRNQCKSGWEEPEISWHYTRQAIVYFPWKFLVAFGILLGALILIGILQTMLKHPKNPGKWAALAALVVSICIFQSIVPASKEARHLLPAIPSGILFAMAGLHWLVQRFSRAGLSSKTVQVIVCAVLTALFFLAGMLAPIRGNIGFSSLGDHLGVSPFQIAKKGYSGFGNLLDRLLKDPANKNPVFLISSDARGEGMFVSEVAIRDAKRPCYMVQRASKLLATSAWNGSAYKAKLSTQDDVLKVLINSDIQIIVMDDAMPNAKEHNRLLQTTIESHPDVFKLIEHEPIFREGVIQSAPLECYDIVRG